MLSPRWWYHVILCDHLKDDIMSYVAITMMMMVCNIDITRGLLLPTFVNYSLFSITSERCCTVLLINKTGNDGIWTVIIIIVAKLSQAPTTAGWVKSPSQWAASSELAGS